MLFLADPGAGCLLLPPFCWFVLSPQGQSASSATERSRKQMVVRRQLFRDHISQIPSQYSIFILSCFRFLPTSERVYEIIWSCNCSSTFNTFCPSSVFLPPRQQLLSAGGIVFSGRPSVRPSHSCERNISGTPRGNLFNLALMFTSVLRGWCGSNWSVVKSQCHYDLSQTFFFSQSSKIHTLIATEFYTNI